MRLRRSKVRAAVTAAAGVVVVSIVGVLVNLATSKPGWLLVGGVVVAVAAAAAIEAWRVLGDRSPHSRPLSSDNALDLDGPAVPRPEKLDEIVEALAPDSPAGRTVAIVGFGGFGKTTLAQMVTQDARIRAAMTTHWVVLGEEVGGAALAAKINDVVERLTNRRPGFATVEQAGRHLGQELAAMAEDGRPVLLVVDDVWTDEQAQAFLYGGEGSSRLLTTRMARVIPSSLRRVDLGPMRDEQSRDLLTTGVPGLAAPTIHRLLELTGRWPLLLALSNGILRDAVDRGESPEAAARRTAEALDHGGPTALDLSDETRRNRAAKRTIDASLSILSAADQERLIDLAIFAEDTRIPLHLIASLWRGTGGLTRDETANLCRRLHSRSLLADFDEGEQTVQLHDVIRHYLHVRATDRLQALNRILLDAASASGRDWWNLPDKEAYLWRHLGYHMRVAGRAAEFAATATDLRWAMAKLRRFGAASVSDDLAGLESPVAEALRRALDRHGHLLTPTDPPHAVIDVFLGRIGDDPVLGHLAAGYVPAPGEQRLLPRWRLPDLPHPAMYRMTPDAISSYRNVPYSPDGTQVVTQTAENDAVLRRTDSGEPLVVLEDSSRVNYPAVFAPDGSWIALETIEKPLRLWNTADGRRLIDLGEHEDWLWAAVASPDGRWLAGTGSGKAWLWPVSGGPAQSLHKRHEDVDSLVFAPDSSWIASAGDGPDVRIRPLTGNGEARSLTGHANRVSLAPAVIGPWLIAIDDDHIVHFWDTRSWTRSHQLRLPQQPVAIEGPVDGSWLAIAEEERVTRWSTDTWELIGGWRLGDRDVRARCLAIDTAGSCVAVGRSDGRINVWDADAGKLRGVLHGHGKEVEGCRFRADGSLVSTDGDEVRVWQLDELETDHVRSAGLAHPATWLAVAPSAGWMSTAHGTQLRFWHEESSTVAPASPTPQTIEFLHAVDERTLAVGRTGVIELWDARHIELLSSTETELSFLRLPSRLVLSPSRAVDSSAWTGHVTVYDLGTGRKELVLDPRLLQERRTRFRRLTGWMAAKSPWLPRRLRYPSISYLTVAASVLGDRLLTIADDGASVLWDTQTWEARQWQGMSGVRHVVADESGWLLTDGTRIEWRSADGTTCRPIAELGEDEDRLTRLAYSHDGRHLCGITNRDLIVWQTSTWSRVAMQRVDGPLTDCAWIRDEIVAASNHGIYRFVLRTP